MPGQPKTTFLDTNALHFARMYLQWASSDEQKRPPFEPCELGLKDVLSESFSGYMVESLQKGALVVGHLIHNYRDNVDNAAYYAHVTRMELTCGGLRSRAVMRAAEPGMPERWWTRLGTDEIRLLLGSTDHGCVICTAEGLANEFGAARIELHEASDPGRMWEASALSDEIIAHVYMETNDMLIYATAVTMMAEELVTYDGGMRKLANYIQNPGAVAQGHSEDRYRAAHDAVVTFLTQDVGVAEDDVQLPGIIDGVASDWPPLLDGDVEEA